MMTKTSAVLAPGAPRIGFVGLGFATTALHLPGARAAGAVVVGGVDAEPARRQAFSTAQSAPAFDTLDALLEKQRPDVVVVATPPDSHAGLVQEALAGGAHVVCEKPFVETVEQAYEVIEAGRRANRRIAVNQEFRFMPIFRRLAVRVGAPPTGRPVFVSCAQFMDLPPWEEEVPWRAAMPHRSLFEGGVHLIDLLHCVLGRSPRSVSAHTSSGLDPGRVADAIHLVTLDYGDGVLAQITIDRLCRAGTRYVELRVDCERESLRASYGGHALLQVGIRRAERPGVRLDWGPGGLAWAERGLRRQVLGRNPRNAAAKATALLYRDTFARWRRGEDAEVSGEVALETLRVIAAAYRSAATGGRVELGDGRSEPATPQ